ncbi:hypothetical protein LUZ61_003911 [Rhynchospora tenuis]|uniref:Aminotransferase-like plant mobile domain-containing protein n=1 Tax=Rhynchospora tenuis TaxID=198213 RepID=A0AAD5ZLV1_9POAL|nr:hypothetical protein LUZ61_003911 [Rhynchospora tenuis]
MPPRRATETPGEPSARRRRTDATTAARSIPPLAEGEDPNVLREADDEIVMLPENVANKSKGVWLKLDPGLITALIEFWRPETHTFHFPAGEMTVTYEDVSHLWGLQTWGEPLISSTNVRDETIEQLLFDDPNARRAQGRNQISLSWLRRMCAQFPGVDDNDGWDRYARAYAMEMIGCVMVPDTSGSAVPACYLPFLQDVNSPRNINWGAAVLAVLFRTLDTACMKWDHSKGEQNISGPMLLLQMWSWTRLPVCRPRVNFDSDMFGYPSRLLAVPFGRKWTDPRIWTNSPNRVGVAIQRNEIARLKADWVLWTPYTDFREYRPVTADEMDDSWLRSVPVVCFCKVSWIYPGRCARQFGKRQLLPPPRTLYWETQKWLNSITNATNRAEDWSISWNWIRDNWNNMEKHHEIPKVGR